MPPVMICLLAAALCISSGFQQGYIASVLNQPYVHIEHFINETITERLDIEPSNYVLKVLWSSLNIAYPISSVLGQFMAVWLCDKLGRKGTALLTCFLYIPGTILSSVAAPLRSFELLFAARIIWSLANGINAVNATVWIIECAPPSIRGSMSALQEFAMAIGALLSQSAGLPLSTESLWPTIFLPNLPLVVLSIVMLFFVPDSPVSILKREHDEEKARRSLSRYHGVPPDECEEELNEKMEKSEEKEEGKEGEDMGFMWIFNPCSHIDDKMKVIREAAWLGILVKLAYVFTGARCLRVNTTFVMHKLSGFSYSQAKLCSWIISLTRVPATLVPVFIVDRVGRRPLLNISMVISVLSLAGMMVGIMIGESMKWISFGSFAALMLINSVGVGSLSRFYAGEVVPKEMLVKAVSILTAFETLIRILVDFVFYPVANIIGEYSMLMFLVPSIFFLFAIWTRCPETNGKKPQQVLSEIAKRKHVKINFSEK